MSKYYDRFYRDFSSCSRKRRNSRLSPPIRLHLYRIEVPFLPLETRLMFIRLKLALPLKLFFFRCAKQKKKKNAGPGLRRLKRDGRIRGLRD